jgi:hypothetical protein
LDCIPSHRRGAGADGGDEVSPFLRFVSILLGGFIGFVGLVALSFWLDASALIPWSSTDALERHTGYQHEGLVLGHEGGFTDYRGMFRLEVDRATAQRIAESLGPPEHSRSTWAACIGGGGPWWWRQEDDALGDCWTGDGDDASWYRIHHADDGGDLTVLIIRL